MFLKNLSIGKQQRRFVVHQQQAMFIHSNSLGQNPCGIATPWYSSDIYKHSTEAEPQTVRATESNEEVRARLSWPRILPHTRAAMPGYNHRGHALLRAARNVRLGPRLDAAEPNRPFGSAVSRAGSVADWLPATRNKLDLPASRRPEFLDPSHYLDHVGLADDPWGALGPAEADVEAAKPPDHHLRLHWRNPCSTASAHGRPEHVSSRGTVRYLHRYRRSALRTERPGGSQRPHCHRPC